jgi:diguanylate cyclase (GGDEF)-like protein
LQVLLGVVLALLPVLAMRWRSVSSRSWGVVPIAMLLALLLSAVLLYFARLWFAPIAALATLLLEFALLAVYRWRKSQELAHSDALTRMANRRMFDAMLKRELAASERSGRPVSLLLIDVDHFKHYNDSYGHQAGDETLRRVARAISKHARRPRDVPARYGGDEMAALLPETSSQAACAIADAIIEEVRAQAIPHADSGVAPVVTVSIGIASGDPLRDPRGSNLLERTDVALYRAKQNGRDRSYCAPGWDA